MLFKNPVEAVRMMPKKESKGSTNTAPCSNPDDPTIQEALIREEEEALQDQDRERAEKLYRSIVEENETSQKAGESS